MRTVFGTVLLALVVAAPLAAQAPQGEFEVNTLLGWQRFDKAAALEDGPAAGIDAVYFATEMIGVGGYLSVGRPTTKGEYFPLVGLEFEDSTFRYLPDQDVTQIGFGLAGVVRFPVVQRLVPYVTAGLGRTRFFMDPEQNRGQRSEGFSTWMVGGGIQLTSAGSIGLRLDVRDEVYTGFDREVFSVVDPLYIDRTMPHPNPDIPEAKSTVHNLRFSLAFSFVPGEQGR
jgi:opacity protein-like surface antigen